MIEFVLFKLQAENTFPNSNVFELDFDDSGFSVAAITPKRNNKILGADRFFNLDNIKNISLIEKIKLRSATCTTVTLLYRDMNE